MRIQTGTKIMVNHVGSEKKKNVTSICALEKNVSGELCLEKKVRNSLASVLFSKITSFKKVIHRR